MTLIQKIRAAGKLSAKTEKGWERGKQKYQADADVQNEMHQKG